jgi:hypothetical protein
MRLKIGSARTSVIHNLPAIVPNQLQFVWQLGLSVGHLFLGRLKNHTSGRQFAADVDVNQAVTTWPDTWHGLPLSKDTSLGGTVWKNLYLSMVTAKLWRVPFAASQDKVTDIFIFKTSFYRIQRTPHQN